MKVVACQPLTPLPLLLAALVSPSSQDRAPKKARLADAIEQANGDGEEPRHRISESPVSDSPKIRTDPEFKSMSEWSVQSCRPQIPDSGFFVDGFQEFQCSSCRQIWTNAPRETDETFNIV